MISSYGREARNDQSNRRIISSSRIMEAGDISQNAFFLLGLTYMQQSRRSRKEAWGLLNQNRRVIQLYMSQPCQEGQLQCRQMPGEC